MEIIGIDVGFGFTKAHNGRNPLCFKSVLGDTTDIQFSTGLGDADLTRNLHVTVDDQSYFLGDFAIAQSSVRQFTLDQERLVSEFVPVLALAAAGFYVEEGTTLNVVSGLPVGFLKQDYERFIEALSGRHTVTYHLPDNKTRNREVIINAVQVMPQPLGSVFGILMDENGRPMNRELPDQKVGVVDIGFRTTDFSVFDRMKYVERSSATVDLGMARSFMAIAEKLKRESGVQVELYRLYDAVENGFIRIKGREYNIANLRDKVFARTAEEIAGEVARQWTEEWDMDCVILTGGGSRPLAEYLAPKLDMQVVAGGPADGDPRFHNVNGYLKFGRSKWRKPTLKVPSAVSDSADAAGSGA